MTSILGIGQQSPLKATALLQANLISIVIAAIANILYRPFELSKTLRAWERNHASPSRQA